MKIALGTAQLGLDYGIANATGKVPAAEAERILTAAKRGFVRLVDTAPAYGDAERVLGELGAAETFSIVTKTARLGPLGAPGVEVAFDRSRGWLRARGIYALLVHATDDLHGPEGPALLTRLRRLRESGSVEKLGISVYSAAELDRALTVFDDVEVVQLPLNVFDQRLLAGGTLERLKERGIEIHARSALLQGLLTLAPDRLPAYFAPIRDRVAAWRAFCAARGLTPLRAAIGFACGIAEVDAVVCGVETAPQLEELIAAAWAPLDPAGFRELALDDPDYVDPSRWKVSV